MKKEINKSVNKSNIIIYSALLVITAFYYFISTFACPLYKGIQWTDTAVFMNIGKEMMNEKIIYKDIVDHKGPIMYLIQIIIMSFENNIWFFTIAVLFGFLGTVFLYKICKQFVNSKISIMLVFLYYTLLSVISLNWNMTEDFANTFMFVGIFFMIKILKNKEYKFINYFWVGFSLALNIMIKPNYIAPWVAFIIVYFILCIKEKNIKVFIIDMLKILAGILVVFLPIVFYLLINGAFVDFINVYFLLNFRYSSSTIIEKMFNLFKLCLVYRLIFVCVFLSIILTILFIKNKKKNCITDFIILNFVFSYLLTGMAANMYLHYLATLFPAIVLIFTIGFKETKRQNKILENIIFFIIVFLFICNCIVFFTKYIITYESDWRYQISRILEEEIEKDKENQLLVLGNESCIYLETDSKISFKYFYQYPIIKYDNKIEEETLTYIIDKKPKIIYCDYRVDNEYYGKILEVVNLNYTKLEKNGLEYYKSNN